MAWLGILVLSCALLAGLGCVLRLAWVGRRRRLRLARIAHQLGLQFSADDPFDLTRRYRDFAIASAGHSPRAENVTYGRYGGYHVRAFDYYFEIGHGPGRQGRRYSVLVADADFDLPASLLWHRDDAEHAPLSAAGALGPVGPWQVLEGGPAGAEVASAFEAVASEPVDIEARHGSVMLFAPARWQAAQLPGKLACLVAALRRLGGAGEEDGD